MKNCVYVGNLPRDTTEDRIRDLFEAKGHTAGSVTLPMDKQTGRSRGFGFVELATEEDAAAALEALRGTDLDGRPLKVGMAYRDKRSAPSGGYEDYEAPRRGRRPGR